MMLSDSDIAASIATGHLLISPYDPQRLQPASLDVCLGSNFVSQGNSATLFDTFRLPPHTLILGHTMEYVRLPADLAARVEGKSTWGRRGLQVHLTAGFIDPGFYGQVTLELMNLSAEPLWLPIGTPIAQLSFHRLSSPAERPYGSPGLGSHYQGQTGATKPYE